MHFLQCKISVSKTVEMPEVVWHNETLMTFSLLLMVKQLSHHSYSRIDVKVNTTNVWRGFLSLKRLLEFLQCVKLLCLEFV